jgi:hypothetical protein
MIRRHVRRFKPPEPEPILCLQILEPDVRFEKDGENCGTRVLTAERARICCTLRKYEMVLVRQVGSDSNTNYKFQKVKVQCPGEKVAAEGKIRRFKWSVPNKDPIPTLNVQSVACNSF